MRDGGLAAASSFGSVGVFEIVDCSREGGLRVERGRDRRAWRNVSLTEVILLLSLFAVLTYMATRTPPNLPIHNSLMDFPSTPQSLAPPMFGRERKDSDRRK